MIFGCCERAMLCGKISGRVNSFGSNQRAATHVILVAVDRNGKRVPHLKKRFMDCFRAPSGRPLFEYPKRALLVHEHIEPTLQREPGHRGIATLETGYANELLA